MKLIKQELEQIRHLKNEIRLLETEYMNMKRPIISDTVTGCTPYRLDKHVITITGTDYGRIEREGRRIDRKIAELQDKLDELEEYINTIEDSQMRLIIRLRYRNGLSWQQIAFEIGHYDEQYPRRKLERFFKVVRK